MVNKLPLTDKEERIQCFIYGYIDDNGYSPTRQEVADKFKITCQAADYFINQLVAKGKFKLLAKRWRNIAIK